MLSTKSTQKHNFLKNTLKIFQIGSISLVLLISNFSTITNAQSANSTLTIDKQLELVKSKQGTEDNLKDQKIELEKKLDQSDKNEIELRGNQIELESQIIAIKKILSEKPSDEILKAKTTELQTSEKSLVEVKLALEKLLQERDSGKNLLAQITQKLQVQQTEVKEQLGSLKNQFSDSLVKFLPPFLFIIGLWIALNQFKYFIRTKTKIGGRLRGNLELYLTLAVIGISFAIIYYGFIENITWFWTSVGLIGTALAFTLQDFVASFFGWLYIRSADIYRTGDELVFTLEGKKYSGKVTSIGLFRTYMRARLGEGFDSEMFTGRLIHFPNSTILKHTIDNNSKNNKIVWHHVEFTLTFESDLKIAKKSLQDICNQIFQESLDNHKVFLNRNPERASEYKPQIFCNIKTDGPSFTIWFACATGYYRQILDRYSTLTLEAFERNDLHLAYPTYRWIGNPSEVDQSTKIDQN